MADIKHNFTISAPKDKVYDAISQEDGLKGWWTYDTTAKAEEGYVNHFRFGKSHFKKIKVTTLDAPNRVHWECVEGDPEWLGTKIAFELEDRETKTFLKFSHCDWAEQSEYFGVCNYHWGRFLASLKSLCETGKGQPFIE